MNSTEHIGEQDMTDDRVVVIAPVEDRRDNSDAGELPLSTAGTFAVSTSCIQAVPTTEQAEELQALGLGVYDQTVLEEGILEQVENAFQRQEKEKQQKFAERTLKTVLDDIKAVKTRLNHTERALALTPKEAKRRIESIKKEKENKLKQLKSLRAKQRSLMGHISGQLLEVDTDVDSDAEELDAETRVELEVVLGLNNVKETEKEKMIRTGQMTPFGTVMGDGGIRPTPKGLRVTSELTDFEKYLLDQAAHQEQKKKSSPNKPQMKNASKEKDVGGPAAAKGEVRSQKEGPSDDLFGVPSTSKVYPVLVPKPKRRRPPKEDLGTYVDDPDGKKPFKRRGPFYRPDPEANVMDLDEFENRMEHSSGSEYVPSGAEGSSDESEECLRRRLNGQESKKPKKGRSTDSKDLEHMGSRRGRLIDDGNQDDYLQRIRKWRKDQLVAKHEKIMKGGSDGDDNDEDEGYEEFEGGYRVPLKVWNKLYRYQQTCVRWLWELHCQNCGGIIGDEMGLGKTIQVIVFLAGLSQSDILSKDGKFKGLGPVLIVTPTTLMHQWLRECHTWWPPFRVAILHVTGSYSGTKESLIRNVNNSKGILITSYSGVVIHQEMLLKYHWHYIFLDEGHKIRNPDARITLACKQFRTAHRFILSGSPLQNHLKELWSLFDFIFPGKLGTLPVFMQQFAVPITQGGYSNATQVLVQTAYKCAVVLRDTISPYLLRRMKADVKMNLSLPGKNEQVLFCRLTDDQRVLYKEYLESKEIKSILDGRLQVFVGLINLRKICNHPDLYSGGPKIFGAVDQSKLDEQMHYGYWKRSGKMQVVEAVLKMWHRQGHRVLLFSQSKQMLDILERFVIRFDYKYLRLDGGTSIGSRQPMIQRFNSDPSIFIFLLTTRVGGLGVNLTGANRVIIYDPDWNPSTDTQARERAWRIGQMRDVTIYRLLTSGTIEEKIYHRQIFKQFLTNRVLKDPRQRRFFKSNDLLELFVLRDDDDNGGGKQTTETSVIFAGTGSEVRVPKAGKSEEGSRSHAGSCLPLEKLQKMKELAKRLSQKIAEKKEAGAAVGTEARSSSAVCGNSKADPEVDILHASETKKHKKKRNRGKKDRDVEGHQIDSLVYKDAYKSAGQDEGDGSRQSDEHNAYVLQKLFAKSGVHTALKHDTIIDSSDPDYMLVEGEAERVAKEAVKALKASRRQCFRAEAGIPTWTGSNGLISGSPSSATSAPKLRFGQMKNTKLIADPEKEAQHCESAIPSTKPILYNLLKKKKVFNGDVETSATSLAVGEVLTSGHLLATMNHRNNVISSTELRDEDGVRGEEDDGGEGTVPPPRPSSPEFRLTKEYDELLVDLRNYIAFQCSVDGQATTAEILHQFKDSIPAQDSAIFKSLLKRICTFDKRSGNDGVWVLNGEFR